MSIAEKLTTVADNQQKVFDAGKKAGYDAFWDVYQQNGNRTDYEMAFRKWPGDCIKPKYNIKPTGNNGQMFAYSTIDCDFDKYLAGLGLTLDFSGVTVANHLFYECKKMTGIGVVDLSNSGSCNLIFGNCQALTYITELKLSTKNSTYATAFNNCIKLKDLNVTGTIGINGLDVSTCTALSHDSLMTIINALEAKTSGTFSVKLGNTNLAKLTDAEKAIATQKGWTLA